MPRPSTGTPANARTLLSAFGLDVELPDATTIQAVLRTRYNAIYDGQSVALERPDYKLHIPDAPEFMGTLAKGQMITIEGAAYYVGNNYRTGDGWRVFQLTHRASAGS